MKKSTVMVFSVALAFSSTAVLAKSQIKNAIVINQSINAGNATIAADYNNLASTGSLNIKDSRIKKAFIVNQSYNKHNVTIAHGLDNTGSTGSLTVE